MVARPHAPVFTDDSGARRLTVQWGGRVIALACVALWAALALTLGTQVSLPGLDRLPSLTDGVRRMMFPDSRLPAIPDVDQRQTELGRASDLEVPRSLPQPADVSSEARPAVEPRRSTKDADRTEAVITGSTAPGKSSARSGGGQPEATPANPKSREPARASSPPTVKPSAQANPRAKAAVSKVLGSTGVGSTGVGSTGVGSKAETPGPAEPDPKGKPPKTTAATPAPRISPSLRPENSQSGQTPRDKRPADEG